ncbi:MAG: hypothetical protein R3C09_18720 [Pirellulaceae bacterium]
MYRSNEGSANGPQAVRHCQGVFRVLGQTGINLPAASDKVVDEWLVLPAIFENQRAMARCKIMPTDDLQEQTAILSPRLHRSSVRGSTMIIFLSPRIIQSVKIIVLIRKGRCPK